MLRFALQAVVLANVFSPSLRPSHRLKDHRQISFTLNHRSAAQTVMPDPQLGIRVNATLTSGPAVAGLKQRAGANPRR
jgi:hypothetical protein